MTTPFAEQLISHIPRLRGFARGLTGSGAEADDLVQATCERALRAQHQWMPGTRMDAWVFRIMRNLWIDTIRQRKSRGMTLPLDAVAELPGSDGRVTTEAALTHQAVQRAIAALPEDQRRLLLFVCAEENTYGEAAAAFGIPIGTVMSRLARARVRLAAALGLAPAGGGENSAKGSVAP